MLFTIVVEGRLTASPTTGTTREGREYVQFPMVHQDRYRDHTGKWVDAKPQFFDVLCWGGLGARVRNNLTRGDIVTVEGGRLQPYLDDSDMPALKMQARNVNLSMRFTDAHPGTKAPRRRGDMVTTAHGEQIPAEVYPEVTTDLELLHR
ncbi:single-stranded DNA-binding protein [Catenuloplanes nepalensis]|uniref:Single-stranded DNA-binding protein n=1 Tax=Catenuloplanes nepalensis TaxID=587533 RepID=A0ABT9MMI0_9ACTN|nr:single-stranded DNA-binding protein [Catenuloplanes nepalensis]MDP9792589.1 single-stranded DNA-binding protein [Catenuloplanes nepalensis]